MSDLDGVEQDADQSFWYDPVGAVVQPCSTDAPPTIASTDKKHWIEIALVDEHGAPAAGHPYKIRLPNGKVLTGSLDSRGLARIEGIDPGTCRVAFPDLDRRAWDRAGKAAN